MRDATPEEVQILTLFMVKVTWINPANDRKKSKELGPYTGKDEEDIRQQALAEAQSRFDYGIDFKAEVPPVYECEFDRDKIFWWSWKIAYHLSDNGNPEEFFKALEKQAPGLEVVFYPPREEFCWLLAPKKEYDASA